MITVQRARELRAMIEKAAGAGLDNKDGSTAVELFPTLTGGGALVKSGTRINWKGALKRATVDLWDTAENTPEAAPNLWEDVLYKNEKVVYLNRVSKTVKGGRVMKFSALVVVGDGKGTVGYGLGKAAEVSEAILKGIADAKKNMVKITLEGTTIPHDIIGEFGAGRVMLKPAPEGTGIIAGGAVRAVMEAVGISNIRAKCLRSNNPQNVVKATMQGLTSLRDAAEVARIRGKNVEDIVG